MQKQHFSFFSATASPLASVIERLCTDTRSLSSFYARFHAVFCFFLVGQLFCFFFFFSHLSRSTLSPFALAFFFLTLFSYLVLLFFFQTKKAEQLLALKEQFASFCSSQYTNPIDRSQAARTAAFSLREEEKVIYSRNTQIKALAPVWEKIKNKLHWRLFFQMKELLLKLSIEELIDLVKKSPTDLETHKALAESYAELGFLYLQDSSLCLWVSSEYQSEAMQQKFFLFSQRAVEEYTILQIYGNTSLWIYTKLAELYHLQKKPEEEIKQYEALLSFDPIHQEALFRLGILYFEQDNQAKGLEIYARLQEISPQAAEELIQFYDLHHLDELAIFS